MVLAVSSKRLFFGRPGFAIRTSMTYPNQKNLVCLNGHPAGNLWHVVVNVSLRIADGADALFLRHLCEALERQFRQELNPSSKGPTRVLVRAALRGIVALYGGRVSNAPVRGRRMPRPHRAGFRRGAITHGDDEINLRRVRLREFVPTLATKRSRVEALSAEYFQRERLDDACRLASSAERSEASPAHARIVEESFREDRARRVTGTKEQDVEHRVSCSSLVRSRAPPPVWPPEQSR
jgi:hypothetical protein